VVQASQIHWQVRIEPPGAFREEGVEAAEYISLRMMRGYQERSQLEIRQRSFQPGLPGIHGEGK
jgi:hypothetical protein